MILYFADRHLNILGQATTHLPEGVRVIEDLKTEDVETGVSIFECRIPFDRKTREKVEEWTEVGNYILRSSDNENEFYNIIDSEIDTKKQEVYIYAEDDGLDLLNDVAEAYEADQPYPISSYIERFAAGAGWEVGINEVEGLTKKLSWDSEQTASARLLSIAESFNNCELSYSFEINGLQILKKYINIYEKRGTDTGIQLRLNKEIDGIVTTKSITNLATALKVTGGTPADADAPITLLGYEYDDGDFYVDGAVLKSRKALEKWSRYLWRDDETKQSGGHIVKTFSYATTSQAVLCEKAIEKLKTICDMDINYDVDISKFPENVKVGDRVNIVDDAGELYLSSRVLILETSVSNMTKKAVLGEHLIKKDDISQKVYDLAEQFASIAQSRVFYTWIAYADDANGTNITTDPTGKAFIGIAANRTEETVDISDPSVFSWSKIKGVEGDSLQVKYLNSDTIPVITDNDVSGWSDTVPEPEKGKKTYMTQKLTSETNWSTPIQISAEDGTTPTFSISENGYWIINGEETDTKAQGETPSITVGANGNWFVDGEDTGIKAQGEKGKDGADIEYVYYRSKTAVANLAAPSYTDGKLPQGWTPSPTGITEEYKYEYASVRKKAAGSTSWGDFSTPIIWSKWGEKGTDGDGIEYKYYLSNSATKPTYSASNTKWTDDPTGVSESNMYEYVVQITHHGDGSSTVSTVALWAKWGETGPRGDPGTPAVSYSMTANLYAIVKTSSGKYIPENITLYGRSQSGVDKIEEYAGRFEIEYTSNGTQYTTGYPAAGSTPRDETSVTYKIPANITALRCTMYLAGGTDTKLDELIIPVVSDGLDGDGYTVILSNDNHTFAGSTTAAVAGETTCKVFAYKGISLMTATIGTITGAPTGMTTSITKNDDQYSEFKVSVNTNMETKNGTLTIPIAVDGKTFEKQFTYSLALQGAKGDPGVTISVSSVIEYYARSSSNTTEPTSWSTTVPTLTSTYKYLWNYEVINYTDGNSTTTAKRVMGVYGDTGSTGKGISSITNYYLATSASSGVTTSTNGWTTGIQTMTSTNKYLWNYEVISYTSGNPTTTTPIIIGTHGATGSSGKGISSTAITYQSSTSGTATPAGTWNSSIPSVAAGSYLWTRTVITYTDGTTSTSYSIAKMGSTGSAGRGISSTAITYQASSSGTSTPTGTWSSSIPSVSAGQYLWTKTVVTYTDSSTSTSYSVGMMGATGATGAAGKGVSSTAVTYQSHTSGTSAPTGTWSSSIPSITQGYYLWTRTIITYTDGSTSTAYSVSRIGIDGTNGSNGSNGKDGQMLYATSSTGASTAAKLATLSTGSISSLTAGVTVTVKFTYANTAASPTLNVNSTGAKYIGLKNKALSNTNPYYWKAYDAITFVYDGTYWNIVDAAATRNRMTSEGLIIGDYSGDTLGSNVLITSSDVKIRNNTTVYATYGANKIELGKNSSKSVIDLCGGIATMKLNENDYDVEMFEIEVPAGSIALASSNRVCIDAFYSTSTDYGYADMNMYAIDPLWEARTFYYDISKNSYDSYVRINYASGIELYSSIPSHSVQMNLEPNNDRVNITGGLNVTGTISADSVSTSGLTMGNGKAIKSKTSAGTTVNMMYMGTDTYNILNVGGGTYPPSRLYLGINGATLRFYASGTTTAPYYFHPAEAGKYACGTSSYYWYGVYTKNFTQDLSDGRKKENIIPFGQSAVSTYSLRSPIDIHSEIFDRLKPVQYNHIDDDGRICFGLIAQDVIESLSELGFKENELDLVRHEYYTDEETNEEKDTYSIAYTNLIAMLIHEVQKLKNRVNELENI